MIASRSNGTGSPAITVALSSATSSTTACSQRSVASQGRPFLSSGQATVTSLRSCVARFSGQLPGRLVITDQSQVLLGIAESSFPIDGAEYVALDVQDPFPFPDGSFDLVLANMLFNELTTSGFEHALSECARILAADGLLLATVLHPDLVHALAKKGALTDFGRGLFAMPSAEGLRPPVSRRSTAVYRAVMEGCGFAVMTQDLHPDERMLREKPGSRSPRERRLHCFSSVLAPHNPRSAKTILSARE